MIIDLHIHTRLYSEDSELVPQELSQRAKRSGLDGICFTEHDLFWQEEDIARLSREYDFHIFPGVEINTEDGHFLVFGLEKYEFGMHHTEFIKRKVEEVDSAIILAHPYRGRVHQNPDFEGLLEQGCRNPLLQIVDAIETLNGGSKNMENNFAQQLCGKLRMKNVGGSDAHSLSEIPSCATAFEKRISNVRELITELKGGLFRAIDLRPIGLNK